MTILRRRILQGSCALGGLQFLSPLQAASPIPDLAPALNGEDVIAYVHRVSGRWDWDLYRRLLGAANEWKEGDAIVGVAASNETERQIARSLLENTTLEQIDAHPPFRDNTWEQSIPISIPVPKTALTAGPSVNSKHSCSTAPTRTSTQSCQDSLATPSLAW